MSRPSRRSFARFTRFARRGLAPLLGASQRWSALVGVALPGVVLAGVVLAQGGASAERARTIKSRLAGVVPGTVTFIFQPAEEGFGGAAAMVKDDLRGTPHGSRHPSAIYREDGS